MFLLFFVVIGLFFCFFMLFIFSLAKVASKADKEEEKLLDIMSTTEPSVYDDTRQKADVVEIVDG